MNRVEPNRNVYIGHRYVPLLVGEWDKSIQYEGLSIVTFKGASYTSKKMTPPGIDIENEEYWVVTGNYDAQVEYYRRDVQELHELFTNGLKDVNQSFEEFKTSVNSDFDNHKSVISSDIEEFKNSVNSDFDNHKSEISSDIEEFKESVNSDFDTHKSEVSSNIQEFKNSVNDEIETERKSNDDRFNLSTFTKYGSINLDSFKGLKHNIDFDLWRDDTGLIKHSHKIDERGYAKRYITAGNTTNDMDGLTEETGWGHLRQALEFIEADSSLSKIKVIMKGLNNRSNIAIPLSLNLTKDYIFTSDSPVGSYQPVNDWEVYQGNVYKGTCEYDVTGVVNTDEKGMYGKYKHLERVNTLSQCENKYNTFFSNGKNLYIHHNNVGGNMIPLLATPVIQVKFSGGANQKIIFKDMEILNGSQSQPFYFINETNVKGKLEIHNVNIQNTGVGNSTNGVMTDGIKDVKLFNVNVFDTVRDGFNYHNSLSETNKCTVFEYNCHAENVGTFEEKMYNNNISSAHERIHIIRVNTTGKDSSGPMIADVNGCYSLNFDVSVFNTGMTDMTRSTNSGFYFSDGQDNFESVPNGKAWLINCNAGSETEWGINSDTSFKDENKIYIDNFKGMNVHPDINYKLIDKY